MHPAIIQAVATERSAEMRATRRQHGRHSRPAAPGRPDRAAPGLVRAYPDVPAAPRPRHDPETA